MITINKRRLTLIVVISAIIWLLAPVYMAFAHKGKVPMPALGYVDIPADNPVSQKLANPNYKKAGDSALILLTDHKSILNAPAISAAVSVDGEVVKASRHRLRCGVRLI